MTEPREALAIEATQLSKRYERVTALRGLSLEVPRGSIYGFIGPNGAGKTTTIKILLGMSRPDDGSARVLGRPVDVEKESVEIRRRTGFVSDDKTLYDYMTVDEIVRFTASFYPGWRQALEERYRSRFGLPADRKVKALSRGMRTKLALLLALCRGSELLILDEPTSGLDPAATEEVLQALVSHAASEETTIFFSSHHLTEIDQVADHVAIIHRGRTMVHGSLDDLKERYRRIHLVFDGEAPAPAFRAAGIVRVRREGRVLTILSSAGTEQIIDEARDAGRLQALATPVSVSVEPVTLKEIFMDTVATQGNDE